jgi:Fe-S cluster assembly protein SufD
LSSSTLAALAPNLDEATQRLGPLFTPNRRRELLERYAALHSGREKPGRYWRIDLEALDLSSLSVTPADAPSIGGGERPGVVVTSLAEAYEKHRELVARALAGYEPGADKFTALAAAMQNTGAFVFVPADIAVDDPITITYAATGAIFPLTLVLVEHGARCTVVERVTGDGFACGITRVVTGENAEVTVASLQETSETSRVFFARSAAPGKDARVHFAVAELGSALSVGRLHIDVDAIGAESTIASLFFPVGSQHVDIVSTVAHNVGESQSDTLVKSAASGRGQARFLGNIHIARDAQGSEAFLRDDALLLSKNSHIDSVPALEIAANEVKAYHGATVGAIDEEQLFYMTSRGIDRQAAETMIALGFFEPVIARFPTEALREEIRRALEAKVQ